MIDCVVTVLDWGLRVARPAREHELFECVRIIFFCLLSGHQKLSQDNTNAPDVHRLIVVLCYDGLRGSVKPCLYSTSHISWDL